MALLLAAPDSAIQAATPAADATQKQATERLFNAVHSNDFAAVQSSVGAGADVEARNSWGVTAAELAVDKGYFRIAHYLVSVRNFQHSKAEQAVAAVPTTQAGGSTGSAAPAVSDKATARNAAASPPAHAGTARTPAMPAAAPATTTKTAASTPGQPSPATAAATPASANGATATTWRAQDGPNPFDPHTPAYGATGPAASN